MEILWAEMHAPGELDPDKVSQAIDGEFQRFLAAQASWPLVTDCDRLDIVFAALNERGVVGLQNAGYMQDDGYDAVWEAHPDAADDEGMIGYCFDHGQDMERVIRGGGFIWPSALLNPKTKSQRVPMLGESFNRSWKMSALLWNGMARSSGGS